MLVKVPYPTAQLLERLLEVIKARGEQPEHKNHKKVIGEFISKFMVAELKHYANNPDAVEEEIEIDDSIIMEPMMKARDQFIATFDSIVSGNGVPVPDPAGMPPVKTTPLGTTTGQVVTGEEILNAPPGTFSPQGEPITRARNGNGHKIEKVRDLFDSERDSIRADFETLNGQIHEDATIPMRNKLGAEVAPFQVTGFVSVLHRYIAYGSPKAPVLKDENAYFEWMKKQKKLWKQYADNKKKREENLAKARTTQASATSQDPQFVAGIK